MDKWDKYIWNPSDLLLCKYRRKSWHRRSEHKELMTDHCEGTAFAKLSDVTKGAISNVEHGETTKKGGFHSPKFTLRGVKSEVPMDSTWIFLQLWPELPVTEIGQL